MDVREAVLEGYSKRIADPGGAMGAEAAQVCRMDAYDPDLLRQVPKEIIERDYGCGNPSKFARAGDVVLDLGSGSGKICYILSQIVGADGQVIGVDMNKYMLDLSRAHQKPFAKRMGYSNLKFFWGSIDDLTTDLEIVDRAVASRKLNYLNDYEDLHSILNCQLPSTPMIADSSVDLVVSNCVINLVDTCSKGNVFEEISRVLRPGGRIALSDNVSNIEVPLELKNDPELWVGCYSGVYQEQEFYRALEAVGFIGLEIDDRAGVPEKTIGEVEFLSVTVTAFKPLEKPTETALENVLYKGPWKEIRDDTGLVLKRGEVTPVGADVLLQLRHSAYADDLYFLDDPHEREESSCCG